MNKLGGFGNQWTWALMLLLCVVGLADSICRAALATTAISTTGTYTAANAAPDSLTTTDGAAVLEATGGSAAPERVYDQGLVRISALKDQTVRFSGRSVDWGCTYQVQGVYVAIAPGTATWHSTFTADNNPRIALEINEDGSADNVVFPTTNGGKLKIWVLGEPAGTPIPVSLAVVPATGIISGLPGSVNVTPGIGTPTILNLTGVAAGAFTITGSNEGIQQASVDGHVLGFRAKVVPTDMFPGRSLLKLGVGETGYLRVIPAPGTTLSELQPLTWTKTAGAPFTISNVLIGSVPSGAASFTAGHFGNDVYLTVTDKNGDQLELQIAIVAPSGGYCVRTPGTNVWHAASSAVGIQNFSIGIMTDFYLTPTDVSFSKIQFKEGDCRPTVDGWFAAFPGFATLNHNAGDQGWPAVGFAVGVPANANTGSKVALPVGFDTAKLEQNPIVNPYAVGPDAGGVSTFDWPIPWLYSTNGGTTFRQICIMHETFTVDGVGNATVSKGGATGANAGGSVGQGY